MAESRSVGGIESAALIAVGLVGEAINGRY